MNGLLSQRDEQPERDQAADGDERQKAEGHRRPINRPSGGERHAHGLGFRGGRLEALFMGHGGRQELGGGGGCAGRGQGGGGGGGGAGAAGGGPGAPPAACSGAKYCGLPQTTSEDSSGWIEARARAMPKSVILARPSGETRMFWGLRSQ